MCRWRGIVATLKRTFSRIGKLCCISWLDLSLLIQLHIIIHQSNFTVTFIVEQNLDALETYSPRNYDMYNKVVFALFTH